MWGMFDFLKEASQNLLTTDGWGDAATEMMEIVKNEATEHFQNFRRAVQTKFDTLPAEREAMAARRTEAYNVINEHRLAQNLEPLPERIQGYEPPSFVEHAEVLSGPVE